MSAESGRCSTTDNSRFPYDVSFLEAAESQLCEPIHTDIFLVDLPEK